MVSTSSLPIHDVLPDLLAALRTQPNAVLVAPPGAGKTTCVAPALLGESWCTGVVWLLSPRRLAARAAAERMSELAGEKPGETIGYVTRLESRTSARTRILVVTEGVFRRRIQADPALEGVSAVLFDEVHERNLEGDFGLALALDAQAGLRDDLRLVAMSATLDGARFSALMGQGSGDIPVIESAGRSYPIDLRHIGRAAEARIEDGMAAAIRRALAEEAQGDLLAFLPGVGEIERTAERLSFPAGIALHRLHGSLDPADQRAALRPAAPGMRKVILATSIAETSLTIDGVRIVVDSGLARRPRHDLAAGMTRLVTERASQASVTQRAGRAGRQSPGVAYRLWEAAATAGLPPYDPPEILESDLTGLLLDCAVWGVPDPARLQWLDAPPAASVSEARRRLIAIGALDGEGRATAHGRAIAELPLDPRLAHMLLVSAEEGEAGAAADVAALLTERGLGGPSVDLHRRLQNWLRERGPRAEGAKGLARRWLALVGGKAGGARDEPLLARCLMRAYPDRIARRRDQSGENWISEGGRAFRLDPADPLARSEWLAVGDIQGSAAGARILSAVSVEESDILAGAAHRIAERRTVRWRKDIGGIEALRERTLGAIRMSAGTDDKPERAAIVAALATALRSEGLGLLPWGAAAEALRMRAAFAGEGDDIGDAALLADAEQWLEQILPDGARRFSAIDAGALHGLLTQRLGWDATRRIDALAPTQFASPAGSHHAIDYAASAGPTVELRVQALFGLADHPTVGSARIPLVLSLTSPAGRPIQTTRDLPAFWKGSWADVAKEMRGRYPRHPWPDDPAAANPTLRTKNADARRRPS
jgi:ATP-dependent helicase HrpB